MLDSLIIPLFLDTTYIYRYLIHFYDDNQMAAKPQRPDGTFNHLKAVSMPQYETLPLFNLAGSAAQ